MKTAQSNMNLIKTKKFIKFATRRSTPECPTLRTHMQKRRFFTFFKDFSNFGPINQLITTWKEDLSDFLTDLPKFP